MTMANIHSRDTYLPEKSQLKAIEKSAFHYCASLRSVELPNGLEEIGLWAFASSGLESITMPPSVRTIHQGAFYCCSRLKKAALNEGLEVLGTKEYLEDIDCEKGVFRCTALKSVELPSTLRRIEFGAFCSCESLKDVTFPDGLEYIGNSAFADSALGRLVLSNSLCTIEEKAFCGCRSLMAVMFWPRVPSRSTKMPMLVIKRGAFRYCKKLRTI